MKATYSLSHSLIAAANPSTIDLIINFGAENETRHQVTRRPLNLSLVIDLVQWRESRSSTRFKQPGRPRRLYHSRYLRKTIFRSFTCVEVISCHTFNLFVLRGGERV